MTEAALPDGRKVRLINLNTSVGTWYELEIGEEPDTAALHLQMPEGEFLRLDTSNGDLLVAQGNIESRCPIGATDGPLAAEAAGPPFSPACGGTVWVRRPGAGARSMLEAGTELLRSTGAAGETLINFYKNHLSDTAEAAHYGGAAAQSARAHGAPPDALLAAGWAGRSIASGQLGIDLAGAPADGLRLGAWYAASGVSGSFAAIVTPEAAGAGDEPGRANDAYFVAWDMAEFRLGYALGGTHPALGWSDRAPPPHDGPGPDGFSDAAPLARIGMVPPWERPLLAGTFAGGFKREHGAFKAGPHIGQHYGFVEQGVVLSRLEPGLMTIMSGLDGMPEMRSLRADEAQHGIPGMVLARQTGYALLEDGREGAHLADPNGNWSGSNDGHLLTMRGGVCELPANGTTYLVYGVFTDATPRAMAATFHAFGCRDAALLDMNAPILVYAAIYRQQQGKLAAEPLLRSMGRGDATSGLKFVDQPDSRDFFYLLRRDPG